MRFEVIQAELLSKDNTIESLKEENDELQEKNKRWISKLDQEIEKNSQNVAMLTKQIKEFQEKNYKLEFEQRSRRSELEKNNFKNQTDEIKKLELLLREKTDLIDELEMHRFNVEEKMAKEQSQMQGDYDHVRRQYQDLEDKLAKSKKDLEEVEVQLIEKDEMLKGSEEENFVLQEQLKIFIEQLEELGQNKQNILEHLNDQNSKSKSASVKLKETERELEKLLGLDKVRQADLERYKSTTEQQKKKIKELENQHEQMIEKYHNLKKEQAELENAIMFKDNGENGAADFEKTRLRTKIEELQGKIKKTKEKKNAMNKENDFYH